MRNPVFLPLPGDGEIPPQASRARSLSWPRKSPVCWISHFLVSVYFLLWNTFNNKGGDQSASLRTEWIKWFKLHIGFLFKNWKDCLRVSSRKTFPKGPLHSNWLFRHVRTHAALWVSSNVWNIFSYLLHVYGNLRNTCLTFRKKKSLLPTLLETNSLKGVLKCWKKGSILS